MNRNIKFQLTKFEKAIAFQIIEQTKSWGYHPEDFWNAKDYIEYNSKNNTVVCSDKRHIGEICLFEDYPDDYMIVYLRTKKIVLSEFKLDKEIFFNVGTEQFKSNKQRDKYYDLIIEALKEWAIYVYKLNGQEPLEPKQVGDIYEF